MKNHYLLILLFSVFAFNGFSQGVIKGQAVDAETDDGLIAAELSVYQGDRLIGGTISDLDGNYEIKNIPEGIYRLEAKYLGYQSDIIDEIQIKNHKTEQAHFFLEVGGIYLDIIEIRCGSENYCQTTCGGYTTVSSTTCFSNCCDEIKSSIDDVDLTIQKNQNSIDAKFYPNPTHDFLLINHEEDTIENITLLDITGRRIASLKNDIDKIEMAHLQPGSYFLQYQLEGKWKTEKVIKI